MHNKRVVGENFFKISKFLGCIASFCVTTWHSLRFSNVTSFLRSGPIKSIHELEIKKRRGFFRIILFLLFSVVPWDFFFYDPYFDPIELDFKDIFRPSHFIFPTLCHKSDAVIFLQSSPSLLPICPSTVFSLLIYKGQLISEWLFGVFNFPKSQRKILMNFCPRI